MGKFVSNAWEIYFHPKLFSTQYQELFDRVSDLREKLLESEFKTNATVKFFAAITVAIETKIPSDPLASHFALTGALKRYGRVKKMGLPERYRLFFRVFDTPELKAIVILWLGFPRKEGAKNDCYQVFTKMVVRGTFPDSLDELIAEPQTNNAHHHLFLSYSLQQISQTLIFWYRLADWQCLHLHPIS